MSKTDRVYEGLKTQIREGQYLPGHRLVLDQVARDYGVSPVPVREAIRRLEAEGHVIHQRNTGVRIATIDPAEYVQVMQTLAFLEGVATSLAAPVLGQDDIAAARDLNERLRRTMEDFDPVSFTRLNQEFHELLCNRCPNAHLSTLVHREWERLGVIRRSTFSLLPGRALTSVEEHENLIRLIEEGAPALTVEMAAREHKLRTLREFEKRGN
ncbi:GntR family transcriptional regulator [Streptomyces sp. NPDC048278]|uniref:GntR family transcriptional regulator n=1 Tax=Streptomyces sp. NPDC048278 TaxID=3155809 RepID=UPI00342F4005